MLAYWACEVTCANPICCAFHVSGTTLEGLSFPLLLQSLRKVLTNDCEGFSFERRIQYCLMKLGNLFFSGNRKNVIKTNFLEFCRQTVAKPTYCISY